VLEIPLIVPDVWQQQAVKALREGRDVVVDAPTGAGKTFIFELFQPSLKGQAVYTVPTRALANDKFATWRKLGWDVGIATGDVAHRLDARVLVATLETQKGRLLQGAGPRLLVIDEYQMIGDAVRGVNYELAIAMAPPGTQILLLSGSVGNPQAVVAWLERIGRSAVVISHKERPVPQEEVDLEGMPQRASGSGRNFWQRTLFNALRAGLGPILVFAPRRRAAEKLAEQLAFAGSGGLSLSREHEELAGGALAKLLRQRVAYHHSGLSYRVRAEIVEPLARAGQLDIVVATMGLAAGIHFSMRSVVVTDRRYFAGHFEKQVEADELVQMFGRAGRRGLDEIGYVLTSERHPGLMDASPKTLRRAQALDWPTLLAVMHAANKEGRDPFAAAAELNRRLFTLQPLTLGVEHSVKTGERPCGLLVDMERARFARRAVKEMRNAKNVWEPCGRAVEGTLEELLVRKGERWWPALQFPAALDGLGKGTLCKLQSGQEKRYGREIVIATSFQTGPWCVAKSLRKELGYKEGSREEIEAKSRGKLEAFAAGKLHEWMEGNGVLTARFSYGAVPVHGFRDASGALLLDPPMREVRQGPCMDCSDFETWCSAVPMTATAADAWRRMGLVGANGAPTLRGHIVSFFNHGEGLAVAAALEDATYALEDMVFDLANLRAGYRFAGDEALQSGRLGVVCQRVYERADYPGYLEMGVPPGYGAGASEAIRAMIEKNTPRHKLLTEELRMGDLERALIEWKSLLRHMVWAPDAEFQRWRDLKALAAKLLA